MTLRKNAASGMKWTGISTVVTIVLQLTQLAVLVRLLSPADFGLMAMVMVVIGFAQAYSDMGISNAIIHRQDITREQLSSLYWLNIFASTAIFIVVFISAPFIAILYREPVLENLLIWASFIFLIAPIGQQFQILLQKEFQFRKLATFEIISVSLGVIVSIILANAGQGVYSLIIGQLTITGINAFMCAIIGIKEWKPQLYFNMKNLKDFISFGTYQIGEKSVNFMGWNLDKVFIGTLLGAQQLGYYNVAYQLVLKPFMVFNPIITRVAFPLFAKIQNDNNQLKKIYMDIIRVIALVLFPVYAGMIVLAKPFILLFLGSNWSPSISVFQILALLGFFYSIGNPLGSLLLAKGRVNIGFYMNVLMILLYGIAISAGAKFGIEGIAAGLVASTAVVLFPLGFWVRWLLVQMRPFEYIKSFTPMLVSSFIMGVSIFVVLDFIKLPPVDFSGLLIPAFSGAIIYFTMIFFLQKDVFCRIQKSFFEGEQG